MTDNDVEYQLKPKEKNSRNSTEKSIQAWKYHFLSGMISTHPYFPLSQWWKMVEQVKITLNLLQPFRLSPKLSSYDQIFGAFG